MNELAFHRAIALGEIGLALPVLAYLLLRAAPYGRHAREGFGPAVGSRIGWIAMEAPASLVFAAVYLAGDHAGGAVPLVLLGMWQGHYAYRAFLYPLGLGGRHPVPLLIVCSGASFNFLNAGLNARWASHLGDYPRSWLQDPRFVAGIALFLAGLAANRMADAELRGLRRGRPGEYGIPRRGLHRFVSCGNYLGELVQWLGWALATWSPSGLAFLVFTAANLLPRALAHHRFYRATFPDYPQDRRALIPYLL